MSKDFNGGYQITLGTTKWDLLNGYTPSWENEEKENFENYDFPRLPNTRAHVSRPLLRSGSSARRTKRRCSNFYSPELYSSPVPITPGR